MKIILILLIVFSGLWLARFAQDASGMTGHFLLDTVLPPRLQELSTPAERMELAGSLQRVLDRQTRYWLAPAILLALSLAGFILELSRDRK